MQRLHWCILLFLLALFGACRKDKESTPAPATIRILVFSHTQGFRHASIDSGKTAILKIGNNLGWITDTTENPMQFTYENLRRYNAVVFLNTTGDILNDQQQTAFEKYIRAGGGFAGIHSATDTEYNWPWYNQLVGAYFTSHPAPQTATYQVEFRNHPSVSFMPDTFGRYEEIYNFHSLATDLTILLTVDESTYTGGTMNGDHPVAWFHLFDGGKSFYTAWGHFPEAYNEPLFQQHLKGGLQWVITP